VEEDCQYLLTVKGMLAALTVSGELEMEQEFQLLLQESITQTGTNPNRYKMESNIFQMTHSIPSFRVPDCKNIIPIVGRAEGTRAAVAEPATDGKSIHVGLYDVSIKTKLQAAMGCYIDGEYFEVSKGGSFDYGYMGSLDDFWVEGTLPVEGGVINIKKFEPFETYKKNLSRAGTASYHVIMKLQKLSSK
jgi:hypothetical protein